MWLPCSFCATPAHLLPLLFNKRNGLDITYVPYRGLAPSISDLVTARTHMAFDALTTLLPLIKEGKLRPLAVLSKARLPEFTGCTHDDRERLSRFFRPTHGPVLLQFQGLPELIVRRLNETINVVALASPEAKQWMLALSLVILGGSPETFAKKIETDMPVWEEIVRLSGAKAQ